MKKITKKLFVCIALLCVFFSAFAQNLTGSWYEDTLWERSRFRKYFYRINEHQLSVVDKSNNTEIFFDYHINNGSIIIKSTGTTSPKILEGRYTIAIRDANYFTINFSSPMSFVRNTYAKEQAVSAAKTSAKVAAIGYATAIVGAVGEKLLALRGIVPFTKYAVFSPNMLLADGRLKPNLKYQSCGYNYKTDKLGRICNYSGKLKLQDGVRNKGAQVMAGGKDRLEGDDGGHLFASIFGGSGNSENLVAMNASINRGEYKRLENLWAKALAAGKKVSVDGQCIYEGQSTRPTKFIVSYIIDGVKNKAVIYNR